MVVARSPTRVSSPPLSSGLGGDSRGPRAGVASGPPSRSIDFARRQAAGLVHGPRQLATLPQAPVLYDRRSVNLTARRCSGVASSREINAAPRVASPSSSRGTSTASSSGSAYGSSVTVESSHALWVPRGPRPSPSARPALPATGQHVDECPPYPGTPPFSRSPSRFTRSGAVRPSMPVSPRAPPEPSFSPPRPSAPPRSMSRAPLRQLAQVSPPAQPMPADEDVFFDMVLPCGLYQDQAMELMYRELGPEDFELLSKLDETVPRRNTVQRDSVDQLPHVSAETLEVGDTCGVCLSEFDLTERTVKLPCGHPFHAKCISKWLTQFKNSCPLCSVPISNKHTASSQLTGIAL